MAYEERAAVPGIPYARHEIETPDLEKAFVDDG